MNRVIVSGLALLTAVALAACQQAPASDKAAEELKAEKDKTAALEQRIADLEKKAETAATSAPAVATNLQASAAAPAPLPVERRTVRRTTTTSRTARKSTPASTTSPRVAVIPEERARVLSEASKRAQFKLPDAAFAPRDPCATLCRVTSRVAAGCRPPIELRGVPTT